MDDAPRALRREDLLSGAARRDADLEVTTEPVNPTPAPATRPGPRAVPRLERILGASTVHLMNWANRLARQVNAVVAAVERRRREDDAEASRVATRVIPIDLYMPAFVIACDKREDGGPLPIAPIAMTIVRHGPPVRDLTTSLREVTAA